MKKEFTETDVRFAYMQGYNRGVDGNPDQMESYITSLTKTPDVEISDEEIEKGAINFCIKNADKEAMAWHDIFVTSAKWYREQLKQL